MNYCVFALCLAVTAAVEGAAMALFFRRHDYVYYSLLCNLLTNPALNLLLTLATGFFGKGVYTGALILLEAAAVAAEAYVYKLLCGFPAFKALGVSAALNAASAAAGLLLQLTGFPFTAAFA